MSQSRPPEPARSLTRDYGGAIVIAVVIALLIRSFIVEAYRIPTTAMKPTLEPGDTIFAAKWPYGLRIAGQSKPMTPGRAPEYGEVIVFSPSWDPDRDSIKRVIGLPGDRVALKNGRVILNGVNITQSAPKNAICGKEKLPQGPTYEVCWEPPILPDSPEEKVPPGSVYVLGDLRSGPPSLKGTAKNWGITSIDSVKAKALWVWLSIEPKGNGMTQPWASRIKFERMFRKIQ